MTIVASAAINTACPDTKLSPVALTVAAHVDVGPDRGPRPLSGHHRLDDRSSTSFMTVTTSAAAASRL